MAIPAGGARQFPIGALNDWVEVRGPGSAATTRMQRGPFVSFWAPQRGFTLVRAVGVVIPPWLST